MPHIDSFFPSDYIKGADLGSETWRVTIKRLQVESIGGDERGEEKERKPVLYFNEIERGLVLNRTNADTISSSYGHDTDGWTGKQLDLYYDPNVMFGHKRVGGVRLQVPRQETRPVLQPQPNKPPGVAQTGQVHFPNNPSRALTERVAREQEPPPPDSSYGEGPDLGHHR